jgi:hypothetical protein
MKRNIISGGLASVAAAVTIGSAMIAGQAAAAPAGATAITAIPVKLADATSCTVTATSTCQVLTPSTTGHKIFRQAISAPNTLQKWEFLQLTSDPNTNLVLKSNLTVQVIENGVLQSRPGCLDLSSDVDRSQQVPGTELVVRACDNTNSQRWTRISLSNGTFELQNRLSLMRLAFQADAGGQVRAVQVTGAGLRMIKV